MRLALFAIFIHNTTTFLASGLNEYQEKYVHKNEEPHKRPEEVFVVLSNSNPDQHRGDWAEKYDAPVAIMFLRIHVYAAHRASSGARRFWRVPWSAGLGVLPELFTQRFKFLLFFSDRPRKRTTAGA